MSRPRIAVTGIGLVTPLGLGRKTVWKRLLEGHCGIAPVRSYDTSRFNVHLGAEVEDFNPETYFENTDPNAVGQASQFAVGAARMALTDASIASGDIDPGRVAVVMGTTSGEPREVERFNDHFVSGEHEKIDENFIGLYPCHVIAGIISEEFGFGGPNVMIPVACAAGNYAMAHGFDLLRAGRADVVLAGGADSFSRITYTGFARLGAVAPELCQPFDKNRRGMVPGEGAAVLVLETVQRARERGAPIYAEIGGYGLSCDAHHMTAADPDGAARAMAMALVMARVLPTAVSYISAHGTGTPTNDRQETKAVKRVFGERIARRVPISSIKSMIGHTMGAASAIEAAVCSLAVASQKVPPTIHLETADPECDLDYVANEAREIPVEVAMNNAYAFGGNNASVIFQKCQIQ